MRLDGKLASLTQKLPRGEYPRPDLVRDHWLCLNGPWAFEFDFGASGRERHFEKRRDFSKTINVPFCPESRLSGLEYKDFMAAVWYQKVFCIPGEWKGKRVLAHFDAIDYEAFIYVNDCLVGTHRGGYVGFAVDITDALKDDGDNVLTVCAEDNVRSHLQPAGKQSPRFSSYGCSYTRTTGIWQSVWLEPVDELYVKKMRFIPKVSEQAMSAEIELSRAEGSATVRIEVGYEGKVMGSAELTADGAIALGTVLLEEKHLWEPKNGRLYDVSIQVIQNGKVKDSVESYFGLRSISYGDGLIKINEKPVFQRLVLDQGFYPDGIYTAPDDEELRGDIERSIAMGFNGARLHQKVFEPRFLFWADKYGYIVWGEQASWVLDYCDPQASLEFLPEWIEVMQRDISHPSIVGWCPYNETWNRTERHLLGRRNLLLTYELTKALDPTRPVIDTSGGFHVKTDIYDVHDYNQDPVSFEETYRPMAAGGTPHVTFPEYQPGPESKTQPYFVSEYGGIRWAASDALGWGYGEAPKTEEEFISRYRGLTHALLSNPAICAFCYTQLTDVEQEVNGLYTYDRKAKFDPSILYKITTEKAAIEE